MGGWGATLQIWVKPASSFYDNMLLTFSILKNIPNTYMFPRDTHAYAFTYALCNLSLLVRVTYLLMYDSSDAHTCTGEGTSVEGGINLHQGSEVEYGEGL